MAEKRILLSSTGLPDRKKYYQVLKTIQDYYLDETIDLIVCAMIRVTMSQLVRFFSPASSNTPPLRPTAPVQKPDRQALGIEETVG